jgi:NRPS condensation-like uncharacterized protein/aryl carrier-like protein
MATADVGAHTKRLALFEISAVVVNNKLQFSFIYDNSLSQGSNVRRWITACKATLETMARALAQRPAEPTLSDYPLLPLTYDDLASLVRITLPRVGISQPTAAVEDIYPCTPVQEGMLISQLRNPNAYIFHAIYNVGHTGSGATLDVQRIRRAWQMVVDRHASLRTVFIESVHSDSVFDQVVLKDVDCGALLLNASDEDAESMLGQVTMASRTGQPLLPHQVAICTTTTGKVLMKLEVNHVAIDGGSLSIVIGDLIEAYNGSLDPGPGPLFSNYIKFIQSQPAQADTRFWMRYLKGLAPCHFPKLATPDVNNTRVLRSTTLQFDRFPELRKLSERTQVTLANIMHAAWAFVLRRYTGSDDICFGYLSVDRDAPVEDIRSTVGTLINMLCCRVRISRDQTLEDVFRTTQEEYLESTRYQRCSLANVQHALGMGGKALYNTSISTQNHSKNEEEADEGDTITFEMHAGHDPSEYAVTVNIETSKNEEGAVFRYWDDHVSDDQAKEIASMMATVLNSFLDSPAQSVTEYDEAQGKNTKKTTPTALRIDTSGHGVSGSDSTDSTPTCDGSAADEGNPWSKSLSADSYEAMLLSIWSGILHLPQEAINAQSTFFEIGGDSIMAMKLVSDARDRGMALTVADVFQHPVLEDMAACARASEVDGSKELLGKTASAHDQYQRFSLLAANNVDAFLQASIVPQVCVFRGGLADVLPATDFQSLAVSGAFLESQFMLNYFFLDAAAPPDLVRLRRACMQLVQDLDILRTVFVPSGGRFLQVVLRTVRPDFNTVDLVDESIQDYTANLQRNAPRPRLGEPCVAFTVIRHQPSNTHRLLLRMSHAIYDGVSLPKILEALQSAYQGTPIQTPPSFANYLRASAGGLTAGHYQHWTELLSGSRMTEIVRRNGPNYQAAAAERGRTAHLQRTIHLPPVENGHITTATVIKAAWAYVLSRATSSRDVVFGHTISGRNAAVDGVANMVGPCVNLLPVRVQLPTAADGDDTNRIKRLLDQVQTQQVTNMPHEVLGFRDIVRHCTDWPAWTYFTTAVQHQNLEPNEAVRVGSVEYAVGCASATDQGDFSDINVVSQPCAGVASDDAEDENMYEITLSYVSGGPVPREFAERALDLLCEAAGRFAADPEGPLMLPSEDAGLSTGVPFVETLVPDQDRLDISALHSLSPAQQVNLSTLVTNAWKQVLTLPESHAISLDTSFFDLGGDIVHLAQLAWAFGEDIPSVFSPVRLDDLLAFPTLRDHMALLAASLDSGGAVGQSLVVADERRDTVVLPSPPLPKLKRVSSPLRKARQLARMFRRKKGDKGAAVSLTVGAAA